MLEDCIDAKDEEMFRLHENVWQQRNEDSERVIDEKAFFKFERAVRDLKRTHPHLYDRYNDMLKNYEPIMKYR